MMIAVVICLIYAASAFGQTGYGGPSMLSRGGNRPGQRGRAPVDISVYGAIRGIMETGLTPVQLNEEGDIPSQTVYGGQVEVGVYGTHSWSKTILGLDYRGDYRYSTRFAQFNGFNHALALDVQHRFSPRFQLVFQQTAGTTNRAFGGFAGPAVPNLSALGVATDEVFDTRVYYSQSTAGLVYQASARTAYIVSGDAFFMRRPNLALVSSNGYKGMGQWQYRVTRQNTIGAQYSFQRFHFPRVYGGTDTHGVALRFGRQQSRNLNYSLILGAFYLNSFGTSEVRLSPEVAELLGRDTGVEAYRRRSVVPHIEADLSYTLERSRMSVAYIQGITPGNGVYLTSQRRSVTAGYSYTGIRKLSLGVSAGATRYDSRSITVGEMNLIRGGGGVNYSLTRLIDLSSQLDWRKFNAPGLRGREGFAFTLGLTVSPARVPLSIW
jgi:hypothetical protein